MFTSIYYLVHYCVVEISHSIKMNNTPSSSGAFSAAAAAAATGDAQGASQGFTKTGNYGAAPINGIDEASQQMAQSSRLCHDANEDDASESMEEDNPALEGHFLTERATLLDCCVCRCHRDETMTFKLTLPFSCSKCSQQFCCKCQFLVHREFHRGERKYECHVCGKAYYYKSDLVRHQPVHSQVKPHVCKVCGRSFNQVGHLITHRLVHTGEKPFSCDVCHKPFNRKSNLQKHKMIHTGERPFHCSVCGSRFSRKGDLQRHTMLHTGERPYKCDICEKSFSQKPHLVSHTAVHTGERPYKCLACGRSFNRKNHLLQHQVDKCPELSLRQHGSLHLLANKAESDTSDESIVEKSYFDSLNLKPNFIGDIVTRSKEVSWDKLNERCKQISEMSLLRARLSDPSYVRSNNNENLNSTAESLEVVTKEKISLEGCDKSITAQVLNEKSTSLLKRKLQEFDKPELSRNEVTNGITDVEEPSSS